MKVKKTKPHKIQTYKPVKEGLIILEPKSKRTSPKSYPVSLDRMILGFFE